MTDDPQAEPPTAAEAALAESLVADRPVPAATFRGALGRQLALDDPGYRPRPTRLRPIVAVYLLTGTMLLLLGLLQATGSL
jgi:hypothetical protein